MSKVKLALLGCGDVATRDYLPEVHRIAGRAELVAACGRTPERVRAVSQQYGIPLWYTDYEKMLAETDADVVLNLTPIQLHAETTLAALQAGKHVYTEKPVATTTHEAARLRDEASKRGLKLVCAPCVMIFPQVRYAQTLLDAGQLGGVYAARGHGFGGVPPWSGYTSDPTQFFAEGAGPAMDMGVYPLHALTGLLGPARRVTAMTSQVMQSFVAPDGPAQGKEVRVEVDDNWHMILDFGDARLAAVAANNCVRDSKAPQLELLGLQGTVAANLLDVSAPVDVLRAGVGWEEVSLPQTGRAAGPDHLLGVEHLLDCIEQDTEPALSVEHALHVVEIIEKAALSAAQGQTQTVESTF